MNRIKKWITSFYDDSVSMQDRIFRLFTSIAILAVGVAFIMGFFIHESFADMAGMAGAIIVFSFITYFSVKYKRVQLGASIMAVLIICLLLPLVYFSGGGIYGGSPIWFVFCFVYVSLTVENKKLVVFLYILASVMTVTVFWLSYKYPELVSAHTREEALADAVAAIILVSLLISLMVNFQMKIFRDKNRQVREKSKEVEELNRAQNRFFSSMSHELRTPINTIIGLNEMILREDVSDEVAEDARSIQGASKMLLALINDVLDMSKLESGKMDIVPVSYDVGAMFSEIVNMVWGRARDKGLALHVDVDSKTPSQLFGDEVRIKQVLINLLNNAIKYTSEGSVSLSVQCDTLASNKVRLVITVADTGMGIKKENIPLLFNAFKRVDEERNRNVEGTGLGLSIVKQLVDLMGGEVQVNSIYTKGSTFVVTLEQEIVDPKELGELGLETRHALNVREHYRQSFEAPDAHLLIVDDNDTNLMVASKLLRDTKVNIDIALSGAECLKKTFSERYDLIFMDHLMPGMDGIECLNKIRSQEGGLNRETPVVVLTANAGSDNQALYNKAGFDGYILKPVSGSVLENTLLKILPREKVMVLNEDTDVTGEDTLFKKHIDKVPLLITTESVCDLPAKKLDKLGIPVIPFNIFTKEGMFLDGVETESDGVLGYLKDERNEVHSDAPQVKVYEEFFARCLTGARHVLHITIADRASNGLAYSTEAAATFDNVTVFDSGHLSSGMGLVVLEAKRLAEDGCSLEEILLRLEDTKKKVHTSFVVTDTDFLARTGRISRQVNVICRSLMLHPVLVMKRNKITVGGIIGGSRENSWRKYINKALEILAQIDKKRLFITYVGLSHEELKMIEGLVKEKVVFEEVIIQRASSAISINCGAGTFGLIFKEE
ncbi:MAG: DegV family EDD domain-containing protein [Lachnospiraceae bacterium]|nr:DegV family EDD domain-containing protein [Lachnospiraceae bacterium]